MPESSPQHPLEEFERQQDRGRDSGPGFVPEQEGKD
jgi:hypothetical protein